MDPTLSPPSPSAVVDPLFRLLEQSMTAWRVLGRVRRGEDGAIVVEGLGRVLEIRPAAPGLPFRWMMTIDGRQKPALSIISVLRQVRGALDPNFKPVKIRFPPPPLEELGGGSAGPREEE